MNRALIAAIALAPACLSAAEKKKTPKDIGPVTLQSAIATALRKNPQVLAAQQEIARTKGQVVEVRADAFPQLAATGAYSQQQKELIERGNFQDSLFGFNSGSRGGDKTWRIAVEARQLIYSGGKLDAALRLAKFTEDAGYYTLRDTVDRVIAQTRQQFYAVLLNRELIRVAEESISLLGEELKDQKNRFDAGTVPRFNVLRAEVELANAKPELIRARNNHEISILELARTMGVPQPNASRAPFAVEGGLRVVDRDWNVSRALSQARARRADVKARERSVRNEEQQITIARAGDKPRLEAHTGWEIHNSRLTDDLSKEVNGWFFGVSGTWNFWDAGATRGRVMQAQAELGSARILHADAIQQVELEVHKAAARVREAKELIASQLRTVEQADEALRLARERLAAGAGTQLDVLDARVALTRARTTELQARFEFNAAVAEFDRAAAEDTIYDDTYKEPLHEKPGFRGAAGVKLGE